LPFARPKIQSQAILLSVVPLAFLLGFLALVMLLNARSAELTAWSSHATGILDQSDMIQKTIGEANQSVVDYTTRPTATALAAYRLKSAAARLEAQQLLKMVTVPSQRAGAVAYARVVDRIIGVLDTYLRYLRSGHAAQARRYVASPGVRALGLEFQTVKGGFDRAVRQGASNRSRELRDQIALYVRILLIATFVAIALTLLTTGRFGLNIADRLRRLAENAERLGAGQETIPVRGNDEIADLDRIYHEMAQRIHDTLSAYRREHYIASTLQRALLPQALPRVPGLRIDTAYAAAAHAAEIGGDWYDVFQLEGSLVAVSVGDVAGHGVRAATIMGSVRQMIRASSRLHQEPATVLDRVNRALCAEEQDVFVTAFFATIDMRDGSLRYAVAGHPLPLHVHSGTRVDQLDGEGIMLGVDPHAAYKTFERTLLVGEGIVGFTDGIVEAGRDYFKGMEDLAATVKGEYGSMRSENIAERIKDRMLAGVDPVDDSAVLFVGITHLGMGASDQKKTWKVDVREQGAAYRVRRAVLWDLATRASAGSDLSAVELILGELLSNVAQHTPGSAEVTLDCRDGQALLKVADRGNVFGSNGESAPDPLSPSGRGLHLIRTLARAVEFENNGTGNSVEVLLPVTLTAA
jgi:serine phosphatase RsbU (regulator of sigma subunit)/anti-sigma regulatory factor (Ser/Thr protein kinase)